MRLNVGGTLFETTVATLTRDSGSMLDALCRDDSPLAQLEAEQAAASAAAAASKDDAGPTKDDSADSEADAATAVSASAGVVFIDRDGALFRHVLNFLRDGVVPQDKMTLRALYREAKYYEVRSLALAIEKRLGVVALLEPRAAGATTAALGGTGVYGSTNVLGEDNTRGGNQQWWERPVSYRGWWPSARRGQADMQWWDGDQYRGASTTSVLRAYDSDGVGTTRPGGLSAVDGYYGRMNRLGATSRDMDTLNTTWDSMGRGPTARAYDQVDRQSMSSSYGSGMLGMATRSGTFGRYSGLRASGGATRYR